MMNNMFDFDATSGNINMADLNQNTVSNEQLDFAPQLGASAQAEYDNIADVNFDLDDDENKALQDLLNDPGMLVPAESEYVDPTVNNFSTADPLVPQPLFTNQLSNDFSNGMYNHPSNFNSNQGIYQTAFPGDGFQYGNVQPGNYQQNMTMGDYQDNTFQQTPNQYNMAMGNYQDNTFEQNLYQPDLNLEAPQPVFPRKPQFVIQENQPEGFEEFDNTITYLSEAQDYVYRNEVLSRIQTPDLALRVIDSLTHPLPSPLQAAFEKLVSHESEKKMVTVLKAAIAEKPEEARKRHNNTSKINKKPMKTAKNKRPENQAKALALADEHYKDIPSKPATWGPINPDTGAPTFEYSKYGELKPGMKFTVSQISDYLSQHPLHGQLPTGEADTKNSGLILWIQYSAADSNKRYPDAKTSNKCRFINCPKGTHAITKGEPRVCFTEERFPDFPTNPFHNAGYVHLYCLEKFLDFPQLCKDFNIKPDTREFPDGPNRMAINKDHKDMPKVVKNFIKNSEPWSQYGLDGTRPYDWYPESLTYRIVEHHLENQPKTAQKARTKRAGNSVDVHKGNLDVWAANDKAKGPRQKQQKRKVADVEDEDEDAEGETDDEDVLDADPFKYENRPIKRARRS